VNPEALAQLQRDMDAWLQSSIDIAYRIQAETPSRENALVLTKLEEAQMWRDRVTL